MGFETVLKYNNISTMCRIFQITLMAYNGYTLNISFNCDVKITPVKLTWGTINRLDI